MEKAKVTPETRNRLLQEWANSSLSQKEFSVCKGIKYATFHSWVKKQKQDDDTPTDFIPLSLPEFGNPVMELVFPTGKKLVFYAQPSVHYLQSLLSLQ